MKAGVSMEPVATYPCVGARRRLGNNLVLPAIEKFLVGGSGKLLEVGCGNGELLAEVAHAGYEIYGASFSPTDVRVAMRRDMRADFRFAEIEADWRDVYRGEKFDRIISIEVIEHVYDPHSFAAQLYYLLNPGGKLLLTTPYNGWLKNMATALSGPGEWDRQHEALWRGGTIKFWSRITLETLLSETGFVNDGFEGLGGVPGMWKSMAVTAEKVK